MASVANRLAKRLRVCLNELQRVTQEANERLSEYKVFNPSEFHNATWSMTESSTLLTQCLSLLDDILVKIQFLPEEEWGIVLRSAVEAVDAIELPARMILPVLKSKLKHIENLWDKLPAADKVIPLVHVAPSSATTSSEKVASTSPVTLSEKNKDVVVRTGTANESSPVHESVTENVSVEAKFVDSSIVSEDLPSEDEDESASSRVLASNAADEITESNAGQVPVTRIHNFKVPDRPFNLKRIYGIHDLKKFLLEFLDTVHTSPLNPVQKFAALRSMMRGEPYRSFIDLSYRTGASYEKALTRLLTTYVDQLDTIVIEDRPQRPLPWLPDEEIKDSDPHRWSDKYFMEKYCRAVPNYECPDRALLVRAIRAFLNLYVVGPKRVSPRDFASVWIILLHGVQIEDRRLVDDIKFGGEDQVSFPKLAPSVKERLNKFAPCFIQKKDGESKKKPKFWKWTYTLTEKKVTRQEQFTTSMVKDWYEYCWNQVDTCDDVDFIDWVVYFALLSMVLFRATVKNGEMVENNVVMSFNRIVPTFCKLNDLPTTVPPHSGVHTYLRNVIFKRNSPAFKNYMTYLIGCYSFAPGPKRKQVRDYLNAGCTQTFSGLGLGSIYWLRRAARVYRMKPEELLTFFLIDPAMQNTVKMVRRFMCTYKKDVTWWWSRVFENRKLKYVSNAALPAFAYACHILYLRNKDDVATSENLYQFTRFINDDVTPDLSGKKLGLAMRDILVEYTTMPLSDVTQSLYRKMEIKKTHIAS